MRDRFWTSAVQMHAVEVAGAALRHDFHIPLGIVGRNAGFIIELIDDGKLQSLGSKDRALLRAICETIGNVSTKIHDAMRRLGRAIRDRPSKDPNISQLVVQTHYISVQENVVPLLAELHRATANLAHFVNRATERLLVRYSLPLISNANRVQGMYSGLHYFFRFERFDEALFTAVDLRGLCVEVAKSVRTANRLDKIPVYGDGDAECIKTQMQTVLQNLLDNATKFTRAVKEPQILVTVTTVRFQDLKRLYPRYLRQYSARGEWVEIHVKDNGPGIEASELPKIFRLYHTKPPPGTATHSTGIGLAVARLIVTLHHGLIFVDQGNYVTDFVILLPKFQTDGIDLRHLIKQELAL